MSDNFCKDFCECCGCYELHEPCCDNCAEHVCGCYCTECCGSCIDCELCEGCSPACKGICGFIIAIAIVGVVVFFAIKQNTKW